LEGLLLYTKCTGFYSKITIDQPKGLLRPKSRIEEKGKGKGKGDWLPATE